ncbi:MAG TPA: hypothetical protein HA330_03060 [Candidatus Thalassarchaeaceae archaeon]|nr:MAG TPA: hypothetical protein D7H85_03060 [Candidatus Poseidoniales archaeon]HII48845.1 hypothetical protein [Candidatus Thalassarchaeaceae archaeon]|tara:strand:+ start:135 stop:1286 length:1152 start_codon:yes stop_codon:yes gene_type:complete
MSEEDDLQGGEPNGMVRLSEMATVTDFVEWHESLEWIDHMLTDFSHKIRLAISNWSGLNLLALSLAGLATIAGAWDLGIGELAGGGDYRFSGISIFNPESGLFAISSSSFFLTIISGALWLGFIGVNWQIFPLMRSHAIALMASIVCVQVGMISAHAGAPNFPFGTNASDFLGIFVGEAILVFILIVVIHRSVTETRDLHVQTRHQHPDPYEMERAKRDHSLAGWTLAIFLFAVCINLAGFAGAAHVAQRPPFESSRMFSYLTYILFTMLSATLMMLILWYPQFMLGGTTLTIESEASRMATAAIVDTSNDIGTCPSCGTPSAAHMTANGIIVSACNTPDCNGEGPVSQDCPICENPISAIIECESCGTGASVSDLFPMEDAW